MDSSVIFTAVNSPTGGSAKLFTLKKVELLTSKTVLAEVERNVRKKLESYHLDRFFLLAEKLVIRAGGPEVKLINQAKKVIHPKDAVILAEAKRAKADYLITLDKKHFLTEPVSKFLKPQRVLIPKMYFEIIK